MNDDLLKRVGGGNYFDELLSRIRDIRSSEKVFYRKVLEIYALSIDYDPRAEATQMFFKTVQNSTISSRNRLNTSFHPWKSISWRVLRKSRKN